MTFHTRRFLAALLTLAIVFPAFAESKSIASHPFDINRRVTVTYDYDAFGNLVQEEPDSFFGD